MISRTIRKFSDVTNWNTLLKRDISSGKMGDAKSTWHLMQQKNISPNEETYKLLINLYKNMVSSRSFISKSQHDKESLINTLNSLKQAGPISTDIANSALEALLRTVNFHDL